MLSLTKPFSVEELLARLRVTQRRLTLLQPASAPNPIYDNGVLHIDFAVGCAYLAGEELHLTAMEYKLLCLLARNTGKVLTHRFILQNVWGSSWENDISTLRVFMDEKGGDGIDMDDEPENDGEQEELDTEEMGRDAEAVADAPFRPQVNRAVSEKVAEHGKERMLADSPRGRISVKEKLAEMREKAYGQKMPEKPDISKGKGKEESL